MYTHGGIAHSTAALAERASATCASRTSTMMSEEFAPGGTRTYAEHRTLHRPEEKKEKRIPHVVRKYTYIVRVRIYIRVHVYTGGYSRATIYAGYMGNPAGDGKSWRMYDYILLRGYTPAECK